MLAAAQVLAISCEEAQLKVVEMGARLLPQKLHKPLVPLEWYDILEVRIFGCQLSSRSATIAEDEPAGRQGWHPSRRETA